MSVLDELELAVSESQEQQGVSALELGLQEQEDAEPVRVASTASTRSSAPARTSSTRRASQSSSGVYQAPAPVARTETVKHTKRDAAIGAGAGAVIGAVAGGPNRRVEGAVVGAVVGGVIGGVIGNNVDKSTRVVYEHNEL